MANLAEFSCDSIVEPGRSRPVCSDHVRELLHSIDEKTRTWIRHSADVVMDLVDALLLLALDRTKPPNKSHLFDYSSDEEASNV